MSFLDTIFRKGRMGRTISREETAERLNPILERHVRLNHLYRHSTERLENKELAAHFGEELRTARSDVAKLNETILSTGYPPFSGTGIEPSEIEMSEEGDYGLLYELLDAEEKLHDALSAESKVEHHMRTRAIFEVLKTNSQRRLTALKESTQGRRRPSESLHATRPAEKAEEGVQEEPETEQEMKEKRGEDELAKETAARVEEA